MLKKVAVLDIDGTLINGQVQQGLINFFYSKGYFDLFYKIRLNILFILYKVHLVHDVKKIFEIGLLYLKSKPVSDISSLIDEYINEEIRNRIFPNSFDLVNRLRAEGFSILLLSTAVDAVVSRIAALFGADDYLCTKLEVRDGSYTGQIIGNIVYGTEKEEVLIKYFEERSYSLDNAVAYADHESDIPMLKVVGHAYIVNPNSRLKHIAEREGLAIMNTR